MKTYGGYHEQEEKVGAVPKPDGEMIRKKKWERKDKHEKQKGGVYPEMEHIDSVDVMMMSE